MTVLEKKLYALLSQGDFRSPIPLKVIRESDTDLLNVFVVLWKFLLDDNPLVRFRAADALEKERFCHGSEFLQSNKKTLFQAMAINQQEVQWHVAQMIPNLFLTISEKKRCIEIFSKWISESPSAIVRAEAVQAIVEIASTEKSLQEVAIVILEQERDNKSAAVRSRVRQLLKNLQVS